MRNSILSAIALTLAVSGGAALAQTANPGVAQLAAAAGVSADGFTTNQLIRLIDAQRENDDVTVRFILSQRGSDIVRSDKGGVSAGAAQYAATLGVAPGQLTLAELIQLDRAQSDNDREKIAFILSGEARDNVGVSTSAGAQALADSLGVNAADYTLAELTALYADKVDND